MSNGNSFSGEGSERECPLWDRIMAPIQPQN